MNTIRLYPLEAQKFAIVSEEDFEWLNRYEWKYTLAAGGHEYATRYGVMVNGESGQMQMHREILRKMIGGEPQYTDHWDNDGLNNQRENLRDATMSQNLSNARKYQRPNITSQYKGVFWNWRSLHWYASITVNKKRKNLGNFPTEIDAAKAYDAAAKRLCGEFARINFPDT